MKFTLINSLILAGVIQGFIFGIIYLFSPKYKNRSSQYLALLILSFSYNNLQFYLADVGLLAGTKMYQTLYIPMGTLIPVFIYFYVLEFTGSLGFKKWKRFLFYIPFIVFFGNVLLYKIWNIISPVGVQLYEKFKFVNNIQSVFSLFYTLVLIGLSYIHINKIEKPQATHSLDNLRWLKKTLLLLFVLSLLWSIALVKYLTDTAYSTYFNILWAGLSFAIYWLVHLGIYKYGVREDRKKIRNYVTQKKTPLVTEHHKNEHIARLEQFLRVEKNFLDQNLTLTSVAKELGISKGHLSRVINTELQTSFSDYVNTLRVQEAQNHLSNPEFSKYTLVAIGLEAGFNSKSTFNNTFKKITGSTPSQYKQKHSK
ncbi:helix-turn-helix domain-containing protein [Marinirhabdus gelatinilytica]|uniref:AraC family transcriptional regulator n=1 Tax=Marinirhabdus gelatinilytica TaxID=1703343 RepID=A0A370QKY8_9FLAO|nr:helix-turn-helix domain-containing protein [Marinirhabdus gelatinilytica]RDK89027.1 AraC family transcriptional regulator [Marinirhabdus gelatinilytica]